MSFFKVFFGSTFSLCKTRRNCALVLQYELIVIPTNGMSVVHLVDLYMYPIRGFWFTFRMSSID